MWRKLLAGARTAFTGWDNPGRQAPAPWSLPVIFYCFRIYSEMAKFLMFALNGPTKGEGDAEVFHKWYNEVHVPQFKAIDLVKSATRYKVLRGKLPGMENWPHLIVYEFEADDISEISKRLQAGVGPSHETLDSSTSGHLWAVALEEDDEPIQPH